MQRKPYGFTALLILVSITMISVTSLMANEDEVGDVDETWPPGNLMSSNARSPVIARAPSGEMFMVYSKGIASSGPDTTYRVSTPAQAGSTWAPEVILANTTGTTISPVVVYDDQNRAHIVWIDQGVNWTVYYARWASGNIDLSPKSVGSSSGFAIQDVDVAVSGSTVVIVWDEGADIQHSVSTNSGVLFSVNDQSAIDDALFNFYNSLAIEADDKGVFHLALDRLATGGGNNIFYTRRLTNGTWQGLLNLTTDSLVANNSSFPDIEVADDTIFLSFGFRTTSNQYAMYLRTCTNNSLCSADSQWSGGQNISGQFVRLNDSPLFIPDLSGLEGEIFGSYSGYLGVSMNEQIWTTKGCSNWSENEQVAVTSDAIDSINPRMVVSKAAGQPNFRFHMVYTNLADSSVYYAAADHVCYPVYLPSIER